MDKMKPHGLFAEDEDGNPVTQIAWVEPADLKQANALLAARIDGDGRSEWVWVRLQNGTLMLATFPQGDTYLEYSDGGVCDYQFVEPSYRVPTDPQTDPLVAMVQLDEQMEKEHPGWMTGEPLGVPDLDTTKYPIEDWQEAVVRGLTKRGYVTWVLSKIEDADEPEED